MKYLSTTETAKKWDVSANRISILANEGRISGAIQVGMRWLIPENAKKPIDGRTRIAKTTNTADFFRFPLYVNFDENDYLPSLSREELTLRNGQKAFHACLFSEANDILVSLEHAQNRYVRLSALYHRLCISKYENISSFDKLLWKMNLELSQDFPYRNEMLMLRYGFDIDYISYKSTIEEFAIDSEYTYHPSAFNVMTLVSFIPIENGDFHLMSKLRYDTQELLCQRMESDGYYLEAQKMHYLLSVVYQLKNDVDKFENHVRRGLTLSMEHELYYVAAFYERLYRSSTQKILKSFPLDFSEKIKSFGSYIQEKQTVFEDYYKKPSYISLISSKELEYAFLANQSYTNREIAQMMKVSEKTVSKIYNEIYDKLGINSKHELVELINGIHKG